MSNRMNKKQYELNKFYRFDEVDPDTQAAIIRKLEEFQNDSDPQDMEVMYRGPMETIPDWSYYFDMFNFKKGLCGSTSFVVKREN